jgi:hypothetical protein
LPLVAQEIPSYMNMAAPRKHWRFAIHTLLCCCAIACSDAVPDSSACRNLVYKDQGLTRKEYLPCAGEMMAVLDELEPRTRAAFRGDSKARADGEASLHRLQSLMRVAGGRNLLERWNDRSLTDLNVDINNAVTHYQAFYMVRILAESHPYAAQSRTAAEAELTGASRRYEEARSLYRRLK